LDSGLRIRTLNLPDRFIEQDTPERMYESAGLDANSIAATVMSTLGRGRDVAAMIA
jgi:1-deoxy-D-xylulose-5-phosphate synthase